jgi:hypothetical protein
MLCSEMSIMNSWLSSVFRPANRKRWRSLAVGMIALVGVLTGAVPDLSDRSDWLGTEVWAQQGSGVSDEEIRNYARAVLLIEPRRQQAYDEIKGISGGAVPAVICNETGSINSLNRDLRAIAVNYCEQAKNYIEQHNLTVTRFNEITRSQQANPNLQERIQEELLRLQRNAGN